MFHAENHLCRSESSSAAGWYGCRPWNWAMAVRTCAAYGYAFDFVNPTKAHTFALNKCADGRCKVVLTLRRSCAAFAIDTRNACGRHDYAAAQRLGQAQFTVMRYRYNNGGKHCIIRA